MFHFFNTNPHHSRNTELLRTWAFPELFFCSAHDCISRLFVRHKARISKVWGYDTDGYVQSSRGTDPSPRRTYGKHLFEPVWEHTELSRGGTRPCGTLCCLLFTCLKPASPVWEMLFTQLYLEFREMQSKPTTPASTGDPQGRTKRTISFRIQCVPFSGVDWAFGE